jgi:hypothetical protein
MIPSRDRMIYCALALALTCLPASAAETPADLVFCHKHKSCYDPCEPVGPIRRFFRSVFRVPCPPQPPPPMIVPVPVVRAAPAPACAPSTILPAAPPAPPARVDIGRPVPVNPPLDVPPPTPPGPVSGFGTRPPRLTPPTPPPPVRLDRLASLTPGPEVTLVHATQRSLKLTTRTDRDGSLTRDLEPGVWLVYTRDSDGRLTFRTRVTAREGVPTRVTLE